MENDFSKMTREELIVYCKNQKIRGYSGKKKSEIVKMVLNMITSKPISNTISNKVHRLNYIGSKYQLLEWLLQNMKDKTGWESFDTKRFADLFAGTGIVSHTLRLQGLSYFQMM